MNNISLIPRNFFESFYWFLCVGHDLYPIKHAAKKIPLLIDGALVSKIYYHKGIHRFCDASYKIILNHQGIEHRLNTSFHQESFDQFEIEPLVHRKFMMLEFGNYFWLLLQSIMILLATVLICSIFPHILKFFENYIPQNSASDESRSVIFSVTSFFAFIIPWATSFFMIGVLWPYKKWKNATTLNQRKTYLTSTGFYSLVFLMAFIFPIISTSVSTIKKGLAKPIITEAKLEIKTKMRIPAEAKNNN